MGNPSMRNLIWGLLKMWGSGVIKKEEEPLKWKERKNEPKRENPPDGVFLFMISSICDYFFFIFFAIWAVRSSTSFFNVSSRQSEKRWSYPFQPPSSWHPPSLLHILFQFVVARFEAGVFRFQSLILCLDVCPHPTRAETNRLIKSNDRAARYYPFHLPITSFLLRIKKQRRKLKIR